MKKKHMTKKDIIQELDILKLKIAMSDDTKSTDLERYHKWVKRIHGRCISGPFDWPVFSNEEYARLRAITSLVKQLYNDEHGNSFEYQKKKLEVREMIKTIVAMTLFAQEKIK